MIFSVFAILYTFSVFTTTYTGGFPQHSIYKAKSYAHSGDTSARV